MKRKGNLYQIICKIENILYATEHVGKTLTNKRKAKIILTYKNAIAIGIQDTLLSQTYEPEKPNKFVITSPKKRIIISKQIKDKIIDYLVSKFILIPLLDPMLIEQNVASRIGRGTSLGVKYHMDYRNKCKINYETYYILKCDISSFFKSIDLKILIEKLRRKIKDENMLNLIEKLIQGEEPGLSIGAMTSQILAVFYLDSFDKFIKEKLKCKYYVRYQDDFLLLHKKKHILKGWCEEIVLELKILNLKLNPKTRIFKSTNNYIFLGHDIEGNKIRKTKKSEKIKNILNHYRKGYKTLYSCACSYNSLMKNKNIK